MYKILLCLRYLRTRYIALASIISVMLGVATMIVVNSVMAGFSTEMRERIHGLLADVIVETISLDGKEDAQWHLDLVQDVAGEYVEGMTATVEVYGMLSFQYYGQWITRPVTLIGIKPEEKAQVGPLLDYLDSYVALREGDAVIRAPLRSRNVPPGWTLTDDAMAYRRQWVADQQWMLHHLRHDGAPGGSNALSPDDDSGFDPTDEAAAPSALSDDEPVVAEKPDREPEESTEVASDEPRADTPADDSPIPLVKIPFDDEPAAGVDPSETVDPANLLALRDGRVYLGAGLASYIDDDQETGKFQTKWMVRPGDDVKISTVSSGRPPDARHFDATVVDVFKSGMSEYDSNLVFCNLEHLQKVRGMIRRIPPDTEVSSITSIQIKLKNFDDAEEVVRRLREVFPPGTYSVRTWEQKQGPLLAAVEVESTILNVLLFLIIAVAGFGILAIFFMIVVEKTRDIGILKALGASSRGVMSIFLSYGLALGIVGSGVGVILGLLFVHYINAIERGITWLTGRKVFDERIYYFPQIPTSVSPMMVLWVALGAMTIAVLASILPARRAARLHPVEALRYE